MIDIVKAALFYIVPTFPLAYVWHLTVFKDRYAALEVYRDDRSRARPLLDDHPGRSSSASSISA